jgi:hypothetical protein
MRSHRAWRHPPPVFRQSPFRARLPKSPFYIQFPPQKYPITSVCRPATGSMSALGPVVVLVRNDMVPHAAGCRTRQQSLISSVSQKRPFQQCLPTTDLRALQQRSPRRCRRDELMPAPPQLMHINERRCRENTSVPRTRSRLPVNLIGSKIGDWH